MRCLMLWLLCVVTVPLACGAATQSVTVTPRPASAYVITDVNMVDVERGIVVPRRVVTIVNDRIDKVDVQAGSGVPESATAVDGRGLYLIPGLVDAHVHYFDAPIFGRLTIAHGVLLVRDMGMPNDYILKLRDRLNRGETLGPEMIATGAILDGDPPLIPPISLGIKTPEEGRVAVREQAKAGVNMIKVYSSLDKGVFQAIADEAQKQGLKVVGHVPDSIDIEEAAAVGLRSSEHFFGFDKIIGRLLGEPEPDKYDAESASMIALLKYGTGLPDNRLERLERSLGIPLPAATLRGIVEDQAHAIAPALDEMIRQAAPRQIFDNDGTRMKVLAR